MDHRRRGLALSLLMVAAVASADFAADRAECSDKLVALATCLTFVQDEAAAPTPDCCAGLRTVLQASRKCLCVLIKDRDDPNLNLKINVTKALSLPSLCNAPANISDCPRLLNLPPNSTEAQVFLQFAKQQAAMQGSPSASPGGSGGATTGAQKSGAAAGGGPAAMRRWWLGVDGVGGGGARAAVLLLFSGAVVPLAAPLLLAL
ncbi:non-specific lipid transfer protein GPI-anchored 14-like isoform X2 [Oryza brachyantha]|nr:non-specific lipid transfer protein GPI-anchored 14-like isoform X2 [Oryza brachyantha]